jgi:hypothetical protein
MPAIMIILNIVFITGIVVAIVGLCARGIISDRPFAAHLTERSTPAHSLRTARSRLQEPPSAYVPMSPLSEPWDSYCPV